MIEFPTEQNSVVLDVHDDFWNPIKELVDEHFPLRDAYWSFIDLFECHSNGWHMTLEQESVDECFGWWDAEKPENAEMQQRILNKEFQLNRPSDMYDQQITIVLWALQQKGLIAPLTQTYLIRIWW